LDYNGDPLVRFGYFGDARMGPLTEQAIQSFKEVDVLAIEGTNIRSDKPSVGITEERVKENIDSIRQKEDKRGGLILHLLDANNIERLSGVIETAGTRTVCVPLETAQILHAFAIMNESLPYDEQIAVPTLGGNIQIFQQEKMNYAPWERQLMLQHGAISMNDVMRDPKRFVIVANPRKSLQTILGSLPRNTKGTVGRLTYWPYSSGDKEKVLADYRYCKVHGLDFKSDIDLSRNAIQVQKNPLGLHASGHMTENELLEAIAQIASVRKLRFVVPIHTELRGIFSTKINEFLRQRNIATASEHMVKVQRGIGKGGFDIPLWEAK